MTHIEPFTPDQVAELDKPLPKPLISNRKGTGKMLSYIEGHDAIDQANRIFGYGNWAYRTLSCEQTVLLDPVTGEPVGVAYKAQVELTVRGAHGPMVEVGSQPVAAWNVIDVVMSRRKQGDDGPIQAWEKVTAQRTIVEAHEHAEKGAVTDAMKRALRTYGAQFGNGLYGDGTADLSREPQAPGQPEELAATVKALQLAAKTCGLASSAEEWATWRKSVLGRDVANRSLTAQQLAQLQAALREFTEAA
jgi:hypothetical protein